MRQRMALAVAYVLLGRLVVYLKLQLALEPKLETQKVREFLGLYSLAMKQVIRNQEREKFEFYVKH
jgi:hypothetical protein